MRKPVLILSLAMILFFIVPLTIVAQTVDTEQIDPEEYFAKYGYITSELPSFYATRSALAPNEMHILDTLTRAERQIIEEAYDPPAIGVIRDLTNPVYFNLNEIAIPENGEISQFGGRITRVNEETLVYTAYFQSKRADEIRLFFPEGNFPPGVKVNLFSRDDYAFNQPELRGTLDEYGFYTTTTFADYVILQVVIPIMEIEENVYFSITKVIHADDRYIPEELLRSCYLDANCADANSFAQITSVRGATAQLSFPVGGTYFICSGGMLNDIRDKDWQPFLLTANHCFDTQTSAAGLEALFRFWSTSCNSGVANPNTILVNGANLISTNSQTDFTLVLLKQPSSSYYLGWSTGSVANNTTMHSTHHPAGTLMKYHRMTNKTSPSHSCSGFSTSDFYYTKVTMGQTTGGSSGGIVVDPEGRVRGQLYGTCHSNIWDDCDYDTYECMWGRFDKSYSINNLAYWLYNGGASVAISTSPGSSYSFGTVNVGSYQDYNITVNNSGSRPNYMNLEAGTAYLSGGDASQFSIIGSKSLYLAPGESGTIKVRFAPASSGKKTTTFYIPHNADNYTSPKAITLTGYGNPCSDIISLGGGGSQNTKTFSKSGEGAWASNFCGYTCEGNEQIYSFTAPITGTYSITVTSTNSTFVDYFWKSTACSSSGWNCINWVYSPSTQGAMSWTAGITYYILLDAEGTSLATHSFYVALSPCSNIIPISGTGPANSKTYVGGGYGSWNTSAASACGYWCEGQEQIYSFVAPRTGNYGIQVTTGGSWVDYMWKTGSCSSADWQCIDDIYSPGLYGEFYWTEGQTYLLLVDDEDNTASNHTFHIQLTQAVGTWTGLVNTDWHNTGNWSFNTIPTYAIDTYIPAGTPNQPFLQNGNAFCKSLLIDNGATFTMGARDCQVLGNIDCKGSIILNASGGILVAYSDLHWYDGSYLEVNNSNAEIKVQGIWQTDAGSNIAPLTGRVYFIGTTDGFIRNYEPSSSFSSLWVYKTDGAFLGFSALSTQPLVINGVLLLNAGAVFNSYTNQNIILRNDFYSYGNSTFDFTLNTNTSSFIFDSPNVQQFYQEALGSGLFNNVIFSSGTATTTNHDMQIAKNLTINQGTFEAGSYKITVGGNWTNGVFPNGFTKGTSRVVFNGTGHNYVKTSETFNILEANMGNALRVDNATSVVTCNQYDWTTGGIDVLAGTFTALDLADNGIFGGYWLNPGGTINLTNSDGWVDIDGNLNIYGGNFNVYGGSISYWPYAPDASITMTGGVLDFKDVGIYVYNPTSYSFVANITGGTIRTVGGFEIANAPFVPTGGTVELYGGTDAGVSNVAGTSFYNLTINKSGGSKDNPEEFITRDRNGETIKLSRANKAFIYSDVLVNGKLIVNAGSLDLGTAGYGLTCMDDASIKNGATLVMSASSKLKLNTSMTVENGGTFRSTGAAGLESLVTHALATNRYIFKVQSGANIGASYTIFEYMGANGITISAGALVDPAQAFNNCTFRQGLASNTLLTINSSQDLVSTGAVFPANTWSGSKNVTKSVNSGYMTFLGYSGPFAGAAFENDPNNRIDWYPTAPSQLVSIPAGWSGLSSYIMPNTTNLPTLFSPIAANFTILQTLSGMYYPAGAINTIGPWASQSAYSVKMNANSTLPVAGLPEHNKVFALSSGWNLLPVICNSNVTTSTLVSGLGANLLIIKEIAGSKLYWPAYGINTLNQLTPGKAYYVRMNAAGSVTFPNNTTDNGFVADEPIRELLTPWNEINRTASSHIIGIEAEALTDLMEGDIIGVFTPEGLCVGNVQIGNLYENNSLYAFAKDPFTPQTDGFTDGQTMIFKLFRPSTGEEINLDVVFDTQMPNNDGLFVAEGISSIRSITAGFTGINEGFAKGISIYPNPTNNTVTISGISEMTRIQVLNALGEIILTLNVDAQEKVSLDLSRFQPGIYQIRMNGQQGTIVRKVVKN